MNLKTGHCRLIVPSSLNEQINHLTCLGGTTMRVVVGGWWLMVGDMEDGQGEAMGDERLWSLD
jgi:hypothetical protein